MPIINTLLANNIHFLGNEMDLDCLCSSCMHRWWPSRYKNVWKDLLMLWWPKREVKKMHGLIATDTIVAVFNNDNHDNTTALYPNILQTWAKHCALFFEKTMLCQRRLRKGFTATQGTKFTWQDWDIVTNKFVHICKVIETFDLLVYVCSVT